MASGIPGAFLFGSKKYKLTLITRQILLAHACLMVAAFATLGSSAFMDIRGVAAVAVLDLLLYFALRRPQTEEHHTHPHSCLVSSFIRFTQTYSIPDVSRRAGYFPINTAIDGR